MKKYLVTGLALLLPVVLTLIIIVFLFDLFTRPFLPIVSDVLLHIENVNDVEIPSSLNLFIARVLALILLYLVILLLGVVGRWFLIRHIIDFGNRLLSRIPFVKTIYKLMKDVFTALFSSDEKKAFKRPVIFPFPFAPSRALGFHAGDVAVEIQEKIKKPLLAVFMPTAPHPISGFLFFVEKEKALAITMSNEEAIKFLVSCGMITPDGTQDADEIP